MASLAQYLRPDVIEQVSRLDLRARFTVEGFLAGLHASPMQGLSTEFSEHRKYTQGDDPRTIDWNVFARSDRLFVRKYSTETHLACHVLVDVSASMGFVGSLAGIAAGGASPQPAAKLAYAINLAAALGFLVTRQQDAIGLGILGEGLRSLLPARSKSGHLVHLLSELAGVTPGGTTGLATGIHAAMARIPHRGLIVLISDLLTDTEALLEALHHVRYRGHDLIVMHVLDARETSFDFAGALRLEDTETGSAIEVDAAAVRESYLAALAAWRGELDVRIRAMRADYVALDTATPFDKALIEFLLGRSRRM